MFSVLSAGLSAYHNWNQDYPNYIAKPIADELKQSLKNSNLTQNSRTEITSRINKIETAGRVNQINHDIAKVGLEVVNSIGCLVGNALLPEIGGHLGYGLATYFTAISKTNKHHPQARATKARIVGGRRISAGGSKPRISQTNSPQNSRNKRTTLAVQASLVSVISTPIIEQTQSFMGLNFKNLLSLVL